jgi:hypothetical protein
MSTPPPTYAPVPSPVSPEPAQPRLSEGARLVNTFIAPRKTFEDIRLNSSWWVPWLLTAILSIAFGAIAAQKIDMVQFARHQVEQSKIAQRQFEQLSPEQQEQQIRIRAATTKVIFYIAPIFSLIIGLVAAAVLMAVFNFGFAAEVTFPQSLAIVFYSFLPRAILAILLGVSLLVASDPNSIDIAGNPMPTNIGFFMDPGGNKFIYSLISNLDLFALWTVCLLGLGFAAVSRNKKLTPGTGIATMLVIYAVLIVIGAGLKAAF